MPPPRTRSSSGTPLGIRSASSADTSPSGTEEPARTPAGALALPCSSSTSVPNASQPGHFPSHLGLAVPHSEQTYLTTAFATQRA